MASSRDGYLEVQTTLSIKLEINWRRLTSRAKVLGLIFSTLNVLEAPVETTKDLLIWNDTVFVQPLLMLTLETTITCTCKSVFPGCATHGTRHLSQTREALIIPTCLPTSRKQRFVQGFVSLLTQINVTWEIQETRVSYSVPKQCISDRS